MNARNLNQFLKLALTRPYLCFSSTDFAHLIGEESPIKIGFGFILIKRIITDRNFLIADLASLCNHKRFPLYFGIPIRRVTNINIKEKSWDLLTKLNVYLNCELWFSNYCQRTLCVANHENLKKCCVVWKHLKTSSSLNMIIKPFTNGSGNRITLQIFYFFQWMCLSLNWEWVLVHHTSTTRTENSNLRFMQMP